MSESGDRTCLKSMRTRFDSERLHRGEGRPSFPGEFHTLAQARCNTSPRNQIEPRRLVSYSSHYGLLPSGLTGGVFQGVAQPGRALASGARYPGPNPGTLTMPRLPSGDGTSPTRSSRSVRSTHEVQIDGMRVQLVEDTRLISGAERPQSSILWHPTKTSGRSTTW